MSLLLILVMATLLDPPPIDPNTATVEELCRLPGIGPVTASAIVEYRENVAPFMSVGELLFVSGIGPSKLENLRPFVEVEETCVLVDSSAYLPLGISSDTLLTVVFLDVGNGDAVVLKTDESVWLIDGGPPGTVVMRAPVVQRLMECGIDTLSVVAFTHPHADHIGGCRDALEVFNCSMLFDPGIDFSSPVYEDLLQYVLDSGCGYSVLSGEDHWEISDGVELDVVWLERGAGSPNEASAVYRVTAGNFSLLITGDIENETIERMTQGQTPVTVMKVPHHGSRTSLFPPWIRKVSAQFAVFSCGRNNPFGHPDRSVVEAWEESGCSVLRTDRQGNIFVYTDGKGVTVAASLLD